MGSRLWPRISLWMSDFQHRGHVWPRHYSLQGTVGIASLDLKLTCRSCCQARAGCSLTTFLIASASTVLCPTTVKSTIPESTPITQSAQISLEGNVAEQKSSWMTCPRSCHKRDCHCSDVACKVREPPVRLFTGMPCLVSEQLLAYPKLADVELSRGYDDLNMYMCISISAAIESW